MSYPLVRDLAADAIPVTVTLAAEGGQLQLNAFEPIIAYSLFASLEHLGAAAVTLADRCIMGITANREALRQRVTDSIGTVTALSPALGYEMTTKVAQEALLTGTGVADIVVSWGLMIRAELEELLSPVALTRVNRHAVPPSLPPLVSLGPTRRQTHRRLGHRTTWSMGMGRKRQVCVAAAQLRETSLELGALCECSRRVERNVE